MRPRSNLAEALVALGHHTDEADARASWRQAVATLGQATRVTGPPPLDGCDPNDLVAAAKVALESGLADDLDWIAPGSAAVALYELSAALPPGKERREIGRRVFARLYEGTATTFAAVATRMTLGSSRSLETPTMRARVGLVFDLLVGSSVNADALALNLIARAESFERWVARPATGALPARRLAALLLEHAAREAAMRSQQGDPYACEVMTGELVRPSFRALLADREPLVWQHAAVARGLLATVNAHEREEIDLALDPGLSPTEWRRAAVSLVASMVGDATTAFKQCRALLGGEIGKKDPGLAATMIYGLPRVIEAEWDAAEELLDWLSTTRRPDVAEATANLLADVMSHSFGQRAASTLRSVLAERAENESPALAAITARALRVLDREHIDDQSAYESVRLALVAYETNGARAAYELAQAAAATADRAMDGIARHDALDEAKLPEVLGLLADLDASALERSRLSDLLLLNRRPGESDAGVSELERLWDRLGRWVLDGEERMLDAPWSRSGSLANQRRLKALLHLVDAETARSTEAEDAGARLRPRLRRAIRVLIRRLAAGPDGSVHRILCATLARSFDAAVREGFAEPSDLFLLVAKELGDRASISTISEASTNPDVCRAIEAYSQFLDLNLHSAETSESTYDTSGTLRTAGIEDEAGAAGRVVRLSRALGGGSSYRGEAVRQVVLRLGRALEAIAAARGLTDLVDPGGAGSDPLTDLEASAEAIRQLTQGAARRVLDLDAQPISVVADVAPLSALVERTVSTGVPANRQQIAMAVKELVADMPGGLADAVTQVLKRIESLPTAAASDAFAIPLERRRASLPDWLLPRRTIGAFYVVRALGSGGTSSVFVARRIEERRAAKAEVFALKVPHYDPSTARSLSEQEFLQMFREEAGALLSLPQHPNLARFVTFDMAARPKPILVMELIPGLMLERRVRSRSLSVDQVIGYLDGILAGLEAMHSVGIGHLDVKPTNVILRNERTPVLVDFGLSGHKLRPGCGTPEYCAPEVFGVAPEDCECSPLAADIYAFGCTAFELLTAELLFQAGDETALISSHVTHDGWPPKLVALREKLGEPGTISIVLAACLRRDPRARPNVAELRAALREATPALRKAPWPLGAARAVRPRTA
jgi:eukaryotic-like serine/threonine-protein kinase